MATRRFFDGAQQEIGSLPIEEIPRTSFWVKVSGIWKKCVTWIRVAGVWKRAIPKPKIGGTWKS